MIELLKDELNIISPLCKDKDDVLLWSCVEGNIGKVWVNNKENPKTAIVKAADFCYLLGVVDENESEITTVLTENCKGKVIVPDNEMWGLFIEKSFPTIFNKFSRFTFKKEPDIFDKKLLNDFIFRTGPEFQIKRIDESIYYKALEQHFTADFCCFYSSWDEFSKYGIGYFVLKNKEIIAGASSYIYCKGNIEITIGTKQEYRGKGLALACAAGLILECLDKNIYPRWEAANPESLALAKKLGYHFEKEIIVYCLENFVRDVPSVALMLRGASDGS